MEYIQYICIMVNIYVQKYTYITMRKAHSLHLQTAQICCTICLPYAYMYVMRIRSRSSLFLYYYVGLVG